VDPFRVRVKGLCPYTLIPLWGLILKKFGVRVRVRVKGLCPYTLIPLWGLILKKFGAIGKPVQHEAC